MDKIIFLFIVYFLFIRFSFAWDQTYFYKKDIIVENKFNGDIPVGFTINFTINTKELIKSNKLKEDCSDLKIVKNFTTIDRIIENCNSENTEIYFKLQNNISKKDIYYLYYGSKTPKETNYEKSKIYYFFDDFEKYEIGQTLYFGRWISDGGSWIINNEKYFSPEKSILETGKFSQRYTIMISNLTVENYTYISYVMIGTHTNVWSTEIEFDIKNYSYAYRLAWFYQTGRGGSFLELKKIINNSEISIINTSANSLIPQLNQWYEFKIIRHFPNIKVYLNNTLIFDVNDSTFRSGSIGFSRYSNIPDSSRKSWYDDVIVMLYMDPWPEVYLGEEEQYTPTSLEITTLKEMNIKSKQKIKLNIFQNTEPIKNLTIDSINMSIPEASITKNNFKNYKNGTFELEFSISTKHLGKKQLKITTPFAENSTIVYLTIQPEENSIIITNDNWKNYITSVTTNKTVLITNSSDLINLYNPKQIFFIDSNITTEIEHYYIDRDTLALIFFKNKEIITTKDKETAILSSSVGLPIVLDVSQEIFDMLKPKKIYNFSSRYDFDFYILTHPKITNYIILANKDSEKSIFASALAFKHNGMIILSSGDAEQTKQKLRQELPKSYYQLTVDYKFKDKIFLVLIDTPYFLIDDPVEDGLLDEDGKKIKTDNPYADINNDYYLDFSVSRLEGSIEHSSHQIYGEPTQNKKSLIISVYDTLPSLDAFYVAPLMKNSMAIDGHLKEFTTTRLVERRSSKDQYSYDDVKSLAARIKDLIKDGDYKDFFGQIKILFSTMNEAIYLIVEFDWFNAFKDILSGNPFVLKHYPIYNEENMMNEVKDKDVIAYMAFGNSTHWFLPNGSIKISSLPLIPSYIFLYYSKSYESLPEIMKKYPISVMASTSSVYMPQSSYSSQMFFENFNGEIAYVNRNAKNNLLSFYKTFKNISFYDPQPYLKEFYSRTLYSEPTKTFDPFLQLEQSPNVLINGIYLQTEIKITPRYSIVSGNAYFYDVDEFAEDIPIYKRTIILPQNAEIIDVIFSSKETYANISTPQIRTNFWYNSRKLLDNRTIVEIYFVPINYNSILTEVIARIIYRADVEITYVRAEYNKLFFGVYSSNTGEANATILIKGGDESYLTKQLMLQKGENNFNISLPVNRYGYYSVGLIIEAEKIAGPKYTYFKLDPIKHFFNSLKLDFTSFFAARHSFKESIQIRQEGTKKIIDYKTSEANLHAEISDRLVAKLAVKSRVLMVKEDSFEKQYELVSPDGKVMITINNGQSSITYTNPALIEELHKMMSIYNEMMLKIEQNI